MPCYYVDLLTQLSLPSFLCFSNTLEDDTYVLEGPINESLERFLVDGEFF